MIRIVEVSKILFMGDVISSYFADGTLLTNMNPSQIEILKVYKDNLKNEFWTNDNTSLYILKKNNIKYILCEIKNLEDNEKEFYTQFRNKNEGRSIKVLQNEGKWEKQFRIYKKINPDFHMSLEEFIENKKKKKEIPPKEIDFTQNFDLSPNKLLITENQIKILPVNQIYFLQETISPVFHDGSSIFTKDPKEITQIEILFDEDENKFYSINNRSLYVLKANKVEKILCKMRLKSNHHSLYDRKSLNIDGKKIKILNQSEYIKNPCLSDTNEELNYQIQNNIASTRILKHNLKMNCGLFLETFNNHETETNDHIFLRGKKRNRDNLEELSKIEEILKKFTKKI
jgi:hypothetical protein